MDEGTFVDSEIAAGLLAVLVAAELLQLAALVALWLRKFAAAAEVDFVGQKYFWWVRC